MDVMFKAETLCNSSPLSLSPFYLLPSSGSMNQFIAVYNANGDVISNIKYYDGFMGQRIGAISCLAFHPYWVNLTFNFSPTAPVFMQGQPSNSQTFLNESKLCGARTQTIQATQDRFYTLLRSGVCRLINRNAT